MSTFFKVPALLAMALLFPALTPAEVGTGRESVDATPELVIEYQNSRLTLRGAVSSEGHRQILENIARTAFVAAELDARLAVRHDLPSDWSLLTELTLRAAAHAQSAIARVSVNEITFQGFVEDKDGWSVSIATLKKNLRGNILFKADVTPIASGLSFVNQCRKLFAAALKARAVSFIVGQSELRPSSLALLDELSELAIDCPDAVLTIIGSGDAGTAMEQQAIQRAEAIAAYLMKNGIDAQRIRIGAASRTAGQEAGFEISID